MQHVKIKQVADFIRKNDPILARMSGNKLRQYIHRRLINNALYFFFEKGEITGFLEYYRFKGLEDLVNVVVKHTEMPLKGHGKLIWVHGGVLTKRGALKRNLVAFIHALGRVENIYWYKIKNKILLCKLRR